MAYARGALKIKPTDPEALFLHSKLLFKNEQYSPCIEQATLALKHSSDPKNHPAIH